MSFGEILVIILVAVITVKPEDIPVIVKKIQQCKLYFSNIKKQLVSYITEDIKIEDITLENPPKQLNPKQLNFYLERIINMQGTYEGEYSLEALKAKHDELIKSKNNP